MNPRCAWLLCLTLAATTVAAEDFETRTGKQLYGQFCAACHGLQGRGDGPASNAFRVEVPDLTLIAHRHGGTYPRDVVERIIDGRYILGAHGTRTMPIWGQVLSLSRLGDPDAEAATDIVIVRLADYVWLLQKPGTAQDH
jgi:mono/diheme cytochrome c family protein